MQSVLTALVSTRGLDLASLGAAYLFLLGTIAFTIAGFALSRAHLVITPNRAARHYGLYVVMVLASLGIASVLENQLVPEQATTLDYALLPQLLLLITIHLWIYYDQQPWLVAVGATSVAASLLTFAIWVAISQTVQIAHWLLLILLSGLLGYLWYHSISTKRGFTKARSIYIGSKEDAQERKVPQTPWLGLPQWVALIAASSALSMLNAALAGNGITSVPAFAVMVESMSMLATTAAVCAVPATTYWLAHRHWMPELTRFVWLVWLVVGFAFTYGNFLQSLDRA